MGHKLKVAIPDDDDFVSEFLALSGRAQANFETFVKIIEDTGNPYCFQIQQYCNPRPNEVMEYALGDGHCVLWKVISRPVRNKQLAFEWNPAILSINNC